MAITVEYAKCPQCGTNNVKSASVCRQCSAPLPWSKDFKKAQASASANTPAATQGSMNSQSSMNTQSSNAGSGLSLNDIAWGPMGVQIVGGLIFLAGAFLWCGNVIGFFRTFPLAGYITMLIGGAIWRAGASME